MKKLYIFALVATMFAACATDAIDEQSVKVEEQTPDTLVGTFEGDDSRIQLQNGKTVWTKGDLVSVFYLSDANQQWQYQGETGSRTGNLKRVNAGTSTEKMQRVVVVYPYNENYFINTDTYNVKAFLPASQSYLKNSYGEGGNIMVSQGEYNQFSLKSVCGWLKVQLTGNGEKVKSIKLKGNAGEQIAGEIYINSATAEATLAADMGGADDNENTAGGNLVFDDTILTEVVLDCGEGVELDAAVTTFYIALPPQNFEKGLTIEIKDSSDFVLTKSTDKLVSIIRNSIQPMAEFKFVNPNFTKPVPANNEIWYTAAAKVEPYYSDSITFGANIVVNAYDDVSQKGIITFDNEITSIGESAFQDCSELESITLPNSIITIGDNAFSGCKNLVNVEIGEGLKSVGIKSFIGCDKLSKFVGKGAEDNGRILVIDGNLVAFASAGISEYTIPNTVTKIGNSVFYNCYKLQHIIIGDSVTSINANAFNGCTNLKEVSFGNNLSTIGNDAFYLCRSLVNIQIPDCVKTIGSRAFEYCSSLTSITIGSQVTSIGYYAFFYCTSLKSVYCSAICPPELKKYDASRSIVFGENANGRRIYVYEEVVDLYKTEWKEYSSSIYSHGKYPDNGATTTFYYTTSDEQIVNTSTIAIKSNEYTDGIGRMIVYGKIESMPTDMFKSCSSLISIVIPNGVRSIGQNAFLYCSSLVDVTIPDSVTTIPWGAFSGCESLKSIDIPNRVTSIGAYAFENCYALENITFPDTIKVIPGGVFRNCINLSNFIIHNRVTEIHSSAFYGCSKITSITIPDSVTEIGYEAFYCCTGLKEVYCMPITPPDISWVNYEWNAFTGNASGRKIYVPHASVEAYKTAEYWSNYANVIVGYDFEKGEVVE